LPKDAPYRRVRVARLHTADTITLIIHADDVITCADARGAYAEECLMRRKIGFTDVYILLDFSRWSPIRRYHTLTPTPPRHQPPPLSQRGGASLMFHGVDFRLCYRDVSRRREEAMPDRRRAVKRKEQVRHVSAAFR